MEPLPRLPIFYNYCPQQVEQSSNFLGGQNPHKLTRGAEHGSSFFGPVFHLACRPSGNRLGDCEHASLCWNCAGGVLT